MTNCCRKSRKITTKRPFFPVLTFLLILSNTAVFFLDSTTNSLTWSTAFNPDNTLWNLLFSVFSHYDLDHLCYNMLFLILVGPMCEKRLGAWRYASLYMVSGICSALGFVLMYPEAEIAGASGAIAGLMAVYPFIQHNLAATLLTGFIFLFCFVKDFLGFSASLVDQLDDTAYLGHLSGGLAGLLFLTLLGRKTFHRTLHKAR